jgi:hypothetical protein
MLQKKVNSLMLALAICLLCHSSYAQFNFHLNSVTRPLSNDEAKTLSTGEKKDKQAVVTFGGLLNIQVSYKVDSPYTIDKALTELKQYCLIIGGRAYPAKNLGSMQIVKYNKDSVRTNTIVTRDTEKNTDVKTISTTAFNSIVFQTIIDPSHSDTNNKKYEQSLFWTQHYEPLLSQKQLNVSLLAPGPTSQSIEENKIITLRFYETWRVWVFVVVFLALITFTLVKAAKDKFSMLRDDVAGCDTPGKANPFSLSRVQVLFWTFAILGMAAYLWAVTDFFPAVTPAHLILLGIAAGQRIIAQMIDSPNGADKQPGLATNNPNQGNAKCSVGFFTDIISDSTGLSITRLQYVIITFIFLVMFVTTAIQQLKLMDFSVEQLALMGTSAGVYLWDKQLNKKAAGAAANPPAQQPLQPNAPQQPK